MGVMDFSWPGCSSGERLGGELTFGQLMFSSDCSAGEVSKVLFSGEPVLGRAFNLL